MPIAENPVVTLSKAIEKIGRTKHLPVHVSPPFIKMVEAAGAQLSFPLSLVTGLVRSAGLLNLALNVGAGEMMS